jgi:hypothetical protein
MTESASRIRKQVYELTTQDFLDHPIWEFCSDEEGVEGQDEATVRPTTKTKLTAELPGACVLAAKVGFADGSSGAGYLYNCEEDDIGCVQPNLLAGASQVNCQFLAGMAALYPERCGASSTRVSEDRQDQRCSFPNLL